MQWTVNRVWQWTPEQSILIIFFSLLLCPPLKWFMCYRTNASLEEKLFSCLLFSTFSIISNGGWSHYWSLWLGRASNWKEDLKFFHEKWRNEENAKINSSQRGVIRGLFAWRCIFYFLFFFHRKHKQRWRSRASWKWKWKWFEKEDVLCFVGW